MDLRKFPRIKAKIAAEVNNKQAMLENVSKNGIKMKMWSDDVPRGRNVEVTFRSGTHTINLKGEVRWCMRDKYSFQDLKEVGLYIEDAPQEYYQFIDSLSTGKTAAARM